MITEDAFLQENEQPKPEGVGCGYNDEQRVIMNVATTKMNSIGDEELINEESSKNTIASTCLSLKINPYASTVACTPAITTSSAHPGATISMKESNCNLKTNSPSPTTQTQSMEQYSFDRCNRDDIIIKKKSKSNSILHSTPQTALVAKDDQDEDRYNTSKQCYKKKRKKEKKKRRKKSIRHGASASDIAMDKEEDDDYFYNNNRDGDNVAHGHSNIVQRFKNTDDDGRLGSNKWYDQSNTTKEASLRLLTHIFSSEDSSRSLTRFYDSSDTNNSSAWMLNQNNDSSASSIDLPNESQLMLNSIHEVVEQLDQQDSSMACGGAGTSDALANRDINHTPKAVQHFQVDTTTTVEMYHHEHQQFGQGTSDTLSNKSRHLSQAKTNEPVSHRKHEDFKDRCPDNSMNLSSQSKTRTQLPRPDDRPGKSTLKENKYMPFNSASDFSPTAEAADTVTKANNGTHKEDDWSEEDIAIDEIEEAQYGRPLDTGHVRRLSRPNTLRPPISPSTARDTTLGRQRAESSSPQKIRTLFDELESFAGESLASGDDVDALSNQFPMVPGSIGGLMISGNGDDGCNSFTSNETISHDLLVVFLLTRGVTRQQAEEMAFAFTSEQNTRRDHQHQSSRTILQNTDDKRRTSAANMTIKLGETRANSAQSIRSEIATFTRYHRSSSSVSSISATSTLNYVRAEFPGAVEMEGRAFGAPPLLYHSSNSNDEMMSASSVAGDGVYVEAIPIRDEEIVFANSSPVSIKYVCQGGPTRRFVIAGVFLFAIGIICYFVLSGRFGPPSPFPTQLQIASLVPSSAPTFVYDDILDAAIRISGEEALANVTSPQFRAVGWLSSFDHVNHEGYGTAFIQRYVMVLFFFSTNGENWLEKEQWLNPELHECSWSRGISCYVDLTSHLMLEGIDQTRNGLSGILPHEISFLYDLTALIVPKNFIVGTLPSSLSTLSKLSELDVSSNNFHGQLPLNLGNASELTVVKMSVNEFSGILPSTLWNLSNLRILELHSNKLSGTIADNVNQLTKLVTLDLRRNLFDGLFPRDLHRMEKLDFLLLDYNMFSGPLPPLHAGFTALQEISFSHNLLTGPLPELDPSSIVQVLASVRVSRIDISYNFITGTVNPAISFLPTLRSVDLSGNLFANEFPADSGWNSIEELAAADNAFTGTISTVWNSGLKHFDFSGNRLNGIVPSQLCELFSLEDLLLSGNALSGTLPACLGNLAQLRAMDFASTGLQGQIPGNMKNCKQLAILNLSNNTLTGWLPSFLGSLSQLNQLEVHNNILSGTIPSELGRLTFLNTLHLANNSFVGTLPDALTKLVNLESMTTAGNALTGSVPESMCQIPNLNLSLAMIGCDVACACCSGDEAHTCG